MNTGWWSSGRVRGQRPGCPGRGTLASARAGRIQPLAAAVRKAHSRTLGPALKPSSVGPLSPRAGPRSVSHGNLVGSTKDRQGQHSAPAAQGLTPKVGGRRITGPHNAARLLIVDAEAGAGERTEASDWPDHRSR
ncbi:hypothetical protein DPEC_G00320060 [Dallia pectoralis]|uniref:Uncharacterized protein n=1 Tax=Dallia pectoralis TaxID=75939 RepID=A0ACC2F9V3_DALPE|nr:hypothetical protein DPEC_G00320060 [Dallia pectoralis]